MRKLLLSAVSACLLAAMAQGPVFAKADNAASAQGGKGCLVADANGAYTADANCDYHIVTRNDHGNLVLVSYHDHGSIPAAAPHPARTRHNDVSSVVGGQTCTGTEITTPSGDYSSDCHFNASH